MRVRFLFIKFDKKCCMANSGNMEKKHGERRPGRKQPAGKDHWQWRNEMAESMAGALDMKMFGIKAIYLIGSTKTGDAGPCSDIDLLVHCTDDPLKQQALQAYFDGWGHCLALLNKEKTGQHTTGSLVDLHLITDGDIEKKDSFAAMIGSVHNSARLLRKAGAHE